MSNKTESKSQIKQELKIEYVDATQLKLDPNNPRKISKEELEKLKQSIAKFGFVDPVIARQSDRLVIGGHQRLQAVQTGKVPVVFIDATDAEAKALNIALNKISGTWDDEKLRQTLDSLRMEDFPLDFTGFDELERQEFQPTPEIIEDEVPEPPKVAVTKLGDVWKLGDHWLTCGDSKEIKCDGLNASLMATDPPYGVAYGIETEHGEQITNDENDGPKLQRFLEAVFANIKKGLKDNAAWYLWHAQMTQGFFAAAAAAADILIHRQIVWVKPSLIMGHGDFHWRHELCFYGWKKGNRPPWYYDRKQDTVWEIGRENDGIHPTQKPVELMAKPMKFNTRENEWCLEPFAGSGTTLIAAEQLNRRCYAIEIEPKYCDVIIERWENLTGKKATKA